MAKETTRYFVRLSAKPTRNRLPVFAFDVGNFVRLRQAKVLAERLAAEHPRSSVKIFKQLGNVVTLVEE